MKKLIMVLAANAILASCSNNTHTCICADDANTIASYDLEGKKETAAFECKQKGMQYSGPEYKDVQCKLDEK